MSALLQRPLDGGATTTVRVAVALIALACMVGGTAAASVEVTPHDAIVAGVERALMVDATVTVSSLATSLAAEQGLTAVPEPTARIGKPSRFVMSVRGARRGLAVATVTASARFARAARPIARDEAIGHDAVAFVDDALPSLPIRPLLAEGELLGRTARRAIAAGETLTASVLRLPPVVRSGDEVEVTVRIGRVQVTGAGKASGSGGVGDTIGVVQPHRLRPLRARIVGPGAVEIVE